MPTKNKISSPLKDLLPTVAAHSRDAMAKQVHSCFAKQTSFEEMWKILGLKEKDIKQKYKGVCQSTAPERSFVAYLDELSRQVVKSENFDGMSLQIIYAIYWVDFLSACCRRPTNTHLQRP